MKKITILTSIFILVLFAASIVNAIATPVYKPMDVYVNSAVKKTSDTTFDEVHVYVPYKMRTWEYTQNDCPPGTTLIMENSAVPEIHVNKEKGLKTIKYGEIKTSRYGIENITQNVQSLIPEKEQTDSFMADDGWYVKIKVTPVYVKYIMKYTFMGGNKFDAGSASIVLGQSTIMNQKICAKDGAYQPQR